MSNLISNIVYSIRNVFQNKVLRIVIIAGIVLLVLGLTLGKTLWTQHVIKVAEEEEAARMAEYQLVENVVWERNDDYEVVSETPPEKVMLPVSDYMIGYNNYNNSSLTGILEFSGPQISFVLASESEKVIVVGQDKNLYLVVQQVDEKGKTSVSVFKAERADIDAFFSQYVSYTDSQTITEDANGNKRTEDWSVDVRLVREFIDMVEEEDGVPLNSYYEQIEYFPVNSGLEFKNIENMEFLYDIYIPLNNGLGYLKTENGLLAIDQVMLRTDYEGTEEIEETEESEDQSADIGSILTGATTVDAFGNPLGGPGTDEEKVVIFEDGSVRDLVDVKDDIIFAVTGTASSSRASGCFSHIEWTDPQTGQLIYIDVRSVSTPSMSISNIEHQNVISVTMPDIKNYVDQFIADHPLETAQEGSSSISEILGQNSAGN